MKKWHKLRVWWYYSHAPESTFAEIITLKSTSEHHARLSCVRRLHKQRMFVKTLDYIGVKR